MRDEGDGGSEQPPSPASRFGAAEAPARQAEHAGDSKGACGTIGAESAATTAGKRSSIAAVAIIKIALGQRRDLAISAKGNLFRLMQLDGAMSASNMGQLDRTAMRLVRRILALVIVLSVAVLPVAGSAAPAVSSAAQDPIEAEAAKMMMTSSDMPAAMHDCCPDEANGQPCNHPTDQCPMAFCAAQPVSIASPPVFQFDCPVLLASSLPIPVDQVVSLHSGSPPFRPPRV